MILHLNGTKVIFWYIIGIKYSWTHHGTRGQDFTHWTNIMSEVNLEIN